MAEQQTQGYLRDNADLFADAYKLLAFLPEGYDLFYRLENTMDGAYAFSFELQKVGKIEGPLMKYTEETRYM